MAVVDRMITIPEFRVPAIMPSFHRVTPEPVTPVFGDTIYVAAGTDVKEGKAKLVWTAQQWGGKVKICIVHVLVPSQTIPMGGLGAGMPANSVNEIILRDHRDNERISMHKILDTYVLFCQRKGVPAEKEYIESDSVQKGIVELIRLHGIKNLVMGAAADNRFFRKMTEIKSRKAIFVRDKAHISCQIWFICDGQLIHTREAQTDQPIVELPTDEPSPAIPTTGARKSVLLISRSATLQSSGTAKLSSPFQKFVRRAFSSSADQRAVIDIPDENGVREVLEQGVFHEAGRKDPTKYFSEFSMTEIKEATQNFDPSLKIGEGGCGSVYRGFLRHTLVAIKIMKSHSIHSSQEFQQEVDVLSKVRHPNLITLMGTCSEPCAIVYEYIPNGSLEDWLRSSNRAKQLPWQARVRIATELCSALAFLHSCKPHRIVHGDVKPGNILLDAHLRSKLSDFGICRLLSGGERSSNNTTVLYTTNLKGTPGYIDPEILVTREVTTKSDVYPFGIILLQLLTRRPAFGIANEVRSAISAGTLEGIFDPLAGEWPFMLAKELTHLALRCCELSRNNRPDLGSDVWTALQLIGTSCQ